MKRLPLLLCLACLCVPSLPAFAYLDHFDFQIDPTGSAGGWFGVTITALGSPVVYDYYGTVTFTVSSGAGTFTPAVSGNFTSVPGVTPSNWVGAIRLTAAGTLDLTCTSSTGATGTAATTVNNLSGSRLLLLFPGQTYTPGLPPGYSPAGVTPTATVGSYYPVTLLVVDQYYNRDASFSGMMDLQNVNGPVLPSGSQSTTDGRTYFTVSFNSAGTASLTSNTPYSNTAYFFVIPANTGYVHFMLPVQAVAGVPFSLTATVSSSPSDPTQTLGTAGDGTSYRIERYIAGTQNAATGTWQPTDYITVGPQPTPPLWAGHSTYFGAFSYDRADNIYLHAVKNSGSPLTITGINSTVLTINPNSPTSLQVSVSPAQIQSQHQATINAQAYDAYGNATRSQLYPFTINFQQDFGNGFLSTTQTATDLGGHASSQYTGGIVNETATIRVSLWNTQLGVPIYATTVQVRVSVAQAEPGAILNFPNPFNPARGEITSINYYNSSASDIQLRIYDAFGRVVLARDFSRTALDQVSADATRSGGAFFNWDGKNGESRIVGNGIYLVKIQAQGSDGTTQDFKRRVGVLK